MISVVQRGDAGGEKLCGVLAEFGFQKLDEVGDVPRDGHVAGHGKFRADEEGFELAEQECVRLRFEQGDEVAEEGESRRGVGVGGAFRRQFAARIWRVSASLCALPKEAIQFLVKGKQVRRKVAFALMTSIKDRVRLLNMLQCALVFSAGGHDLEK